ncbi:PAS domain S-box-containing protein [Sphingopyxis sp. OAS728]|uniref:sensor histidine kinase n=1 Tax=Sphingopyxis sp. OAS728 TaxID=2663823 RepID=UPI001789E599|nr:HWE histidine kinase domain-containing protein [Sphingopyxis sp. OAS728]MBE1529452.1 PAS domain S-box-containing protein [Sphingopyxis sp. OAS728]
MILAPVGRDGAAAAEIVARAGIAAEVCADFLALVGALREDCLAVIATEEGFFGKDLTRLADRVRSQPAWSDIPFIILTSQLPQRRVARWRNDLVTSLGNVTLIERPVQAITLTSSVRAAVRARERQYELRELLGELERGHERFQLIVENARDYAIILSDPEDLITDWLPGASAVFGWSEGDMVGKPVSRIFTPEDRAHGIPEQELERARSDGVAPNIRWHLAKGGARVFIDGQTVSLRNRDGTIRGFMKIGKDITERQRNEERQAVLLAELQHRVRNVLAMVASVVNRGATDGTTAEFRDRLSGRIAAMARTQALLTRGAGVGVELGGLVRDELLAQAADESRVSIVGPEILLAPKAAEVLTLAIHELATNASKYGAVRAPSGRVDVHWSRLSRDGSEWLELVWAESGVRIEPKPDRRKGFGTELVTRRVPYELRGEGELTHDPDGVRCRIAFPLNEGESVLQTDLPIAYRKSKENWV